MIHFRLGLVTVIILIRISLSSRIRQPDFATGNFLCANPINDPTVNIRAAEVAALVADRHLFVTNTAKPQHRGVEVVIAHALTVLEITITQFVGAGPGEAGFYAASQILNVFPR